MPRVHPETGLVVSGVGDGIVSVGSETGKGREVASGGGACWVDAHRIVYQRKADWRVAILDTRTGQSEPVGHDANFICGGGGQWASHGSRGIEGSLSFPDGAVLALASTDGRGAAGPDGTIAATQPPSATGFTLHAPGGGRVSAAAGEAAYNLTILSATQAIWPLHGRFRTLNLPEPFQFGVVGRACWCAVDGRVWLVHYLEDVGLVVREHGSPMGKVIETAGIYFHYDAVAWQGGIRVAYSASPGELPHELIVRDDVDVSAGLIDISALLAKPAPKPTPTPPPDPTPTPIPEPPPMNDPRLRNRSDLVARLRRDLFGIADNQPLKDHRKSFALTQAVAWELRDEGCGLVKAKPGSDNNVDGYTSDIIAWPDGEHVDVVQDAEGFGGALWDPVRFRDEWQQSWNDAIKSRWVPAMAPIGGQPAPQPKPEDPKDGPKPAPDTGEMERLRQDLSVALSRITQLEAEKSFQWDRADALEHERNELHARVVELENQPSTCNGNKFGRIRIGCTRE